jgi:hypothetical protein
MFCNCERSLYTFTKNSNDAKAHYIKYCKILQRVLKLAKKQHYSSLVAKSNNKIKTTWNIIKKEGGEVHSVDQVPSLPVYDAKSEDAKNMANVFNNFFATVTEKLNMQQIETGHAISVLKDSFPGKFPSIKITSIRESEL